MPHGPFNRVDPGDKYRSSHINELQDALEETYTSSESDATYADKTATEAAIADVTPSSEGYIVQGTGAGAEKVKHRTHHGITVAASDTPAHMRKMADYVCDGTADDVQWQAALDEAEDGATRSMQVHLLPGSYYLAATVNWGPVDIIGAGGNVAHGVRVYWSGAAGGTVINSTHSSAGVMRGISFRGGVTNHPATHIDFTSTFVDVYRRLEEVHFGACTGAAIKLEGWVNLHWYGLRFDSWGTYAVDARPANWPICMSFVIDGFTADSGLTAGNLGLMYLQPPDGGGSNSGPITWRDGRIEINNAMAAPATLFHMKHGTTVATRSADIRLEDVSIQDAGSTPTLSILYRDTANTSSTDRLTLSGVDTAGLGSVLAGTWGSAVTIPPVQGWYPFLNHSRSAVMMDRLHLYGNGSSGDKAMAVRYGTDTEDRIYIDHQGRMYFGPGGSTAADTHIRRAGATTLRVETNLAIPGYFDATETAAPSAPAANTGRLFVQDNGAGKSQLCVRFATGAVQVIATEP